MRSTLYEDRPRYDLWVKLSLGFSLAVIVALAAMAFVDGYARDVMPDQTAASSRQAGVVLLGLTALLAALYWGLMPQRFQVLDDRVRVKLGLFIFDIGFSAIKSARAAGGIGWTAVSFVTSLRSQVEIKRRRGLAVRFSPGDSPAFLEHLEGAIREWDRLHGGTPRG